MATHPGFPARPLLRPGVRVCRRRDGELQVGLDTRLAVVAPETPAVRLVLDGLRNGVAPPSPAELDAAGVRLCAALLEKRLVVDADVLLPLLACDDAERVAGLTATVSSAGLEAGVLLGRRRAAGVRIVSAGLDRAADRSAELLAACSIGRGEEVVLHVGAEPERTLVDEWMRADLPHLFLVVSEGLVRVGPFVVPGRTACLRCVDAHHTERDPRMPLALHQYAEARGPRDGLPDPVPADLLELALGFVVRDLVSWVDGLRPAAWSTTIEVDPGLALPRRQWPRHPGCGCAWDLAVAG